jgi:pimeloyl-ACP methyl ester carboxylesterase
MISIYALLVGINNYPVKPLNGCINDVNAVHDYLTRMYGKRTDVTLRVMRITDADAVSPSRQNIINGFDHFAPAGSDDTCLFYYSGHGSYSPAPETFWTETDQRTESFVCIDSRMEGGRDLMDKEMGYLIWKTLQGKPDTRFVVITDCCHCGTITRTVDDSGTIDRMMPDAAESVPLDAYLGLGEKINGLTYYETIPAAGGQAARINFRQAPHIHLAASRDNQTAKELNIDGVKRGAFTHSLLRTLYAVNGNISYRDLINKTGLLVRNLVSDQHPSVSVAGDVLRDIAGDVFLTSAKANADSLMVYYDSRWRWCINGGLIHGVSLGDEVVIEGVGNAIVTGTPAPDFSTINALDGFGAPSTNYIARIIRQPNQAMPVSTDKTISAAQLGMLLKAFSSDKAAMAGVAIGNNGRFIIRSTGGAFYVTKPGSLKPLMKPVPVNSEADISLFVQRFLHIVRWTNLLELNQCSFPPDAYVISLYRNRYPGNYDAATFGQLQAEDAGYDFPYQQDDSGNWQQPAFRLAITNTSLAPLWVATAWLGFDYSIATDFFDEIQLLAPGTTAWLNFISDGRPEDIVVLNLDHKYATLGYQQISEHLKLFISTQRIDTDKLKQDGIDIPYQESRSVEYRSPASVNARKPGAFNWNCETITFNISTPAKKTLITPLNDTRLQQVTIVAHPSLTAQVALVSSSISRSANEIAPPHAAAGNSWLEPFDFGARDKGAQQLDVLELTNVGDGSEVTPQTPLILRSGDADISDVLAIGYSQSEHIYYPVGFSNDAGEIIIDILPDPTPVDESVNAKSLGGSIKIYFQKIIGKRLGLEYGFPRLALTTVHADGSLTYNSDVEVMQQAVAGAQKILLFVHGIIGDSASIVNCVRKGKAGTSLADRSDLVLSFDYENLNTTIQENAALLKSKLAQVGLAAGHNKKLVVVAHSMGGLVSRWFIEKLQGNRVVSELVMLGTPNNGTPWADVRDMAQTLLTYALNGAAFLKPWMFLLNIAGKLTGGTQVTLKQMDKDTGIYKQLNDGTDPGISYTIVAGDTKAIIPNFDQTASLLSRIFVRLKKRGLYDGLDLLLFREANDIAVTSKSIVSTGDRLLWSRQPTVIAVACDHMNYFNHQPALNAIINLV